MEWQVSFKSEDENEARIVSNAFRMQSDISEILDIIRQRIKYQNPTDEEVIVLDKIRNILYKYEDF